MPDVQAPRRDLLAIISATLGVICALSGFAGLFWTTFGTQSDTVPVAQHTGIGTVTTRPTATFVSSAGQNQKRWEADITLSDGRHEHIVLPSEHYRLGDRLKYWQRNDNPHAVSAYQIPNDPTPSLMAHAIVRGSCSIALILLGITFLIWSGKRLEAASSYDGSS